MKSVKSTLHRGGEGQNVQRAKFSNTYGQGCRLLSKDPVSSVSGSTELVVKPRAFGWLRR